VSVVAIPWTWIVTGSGFDWFFPPAETWIAPPYVPGAVPNGTDTGKFTATGEFALTEARLDGDGVTNAVTPGTAMIFTLLNAVDDLNDAEVLVFCPAVRVRSIEVGVQVIPGLAGLAAGTAPASQPTMPATTASVIARRAITGSSRARGRPALMSVASWSSSSPSP
jgi:hypothetical protein